MPFLPAAWPAVLGPVRLNQATPVGAEEIGRLLRRVSELSALTVPSIAPSSISRIVLGGELSGSQKGSMTRGLCGD